MVVVRFDDSKRRRRRRRRQQQPQQQQQPKKKRVPSKFLRNTTLFMIFGYALWLSYDTVPWKQKGCSLGFVDVLGGTLTTGDVGGTALDELPSQGAF